jgi:hypothetical protein
MTMGSPVDDLLLNLKLQLLALPSLARWGLLAFAGVVILKEGIEIGWRLYRGSASRAPSLAPGDAPAALPAPDPLANPSMSGREVEKPLPVITPRPGDSHG